MKKGKTEIEKDKTLNMIGIVMMAGAIPVALVWISMLVVGGMINGEVPAFFSAFIIAGTVGALLGLANGFMVVRQNDSTKKLRFSFAIIIALLSLPGGVMFIQMNWNFASIPVLLFGFGPSAYYLVKIYDAYNERKL